MQSDSPECDEVRELFRQRKVEAKCVEATAPVREALTEITGQDVLPQVFVNGMHLGG